MFHDFYGHTQGQQWDYYFKKLIQTWNFQPENSARADEEGGGRKSLFTYFSSQLK